MSDQIEWKEEYEIGVAHIDFQHRKLVNLLERLRQSLGQGLDNPVVGTTLKSIVDYTQSHFADEEKLMRQIGFVGIEEHTLLHRQLLSEVASILQKLKKGGEFTPEDLLQFLVRWVTDHVIKEDTKIGVAFREMKAAQPT